MEDTNMEVPVEAGAGVEETPAPTTSETPVEAPVEPTPVDEAGNQVAGEAGVEAPAPTTPQEEQPAV